MCRILEIPIPGVVDHQNKVYIYTRHWVFSLELSVQWNSLVCVSVSVCVCVCLYCCEVIVCIDIIIC